METAINVVGKALVLYLSFFGKKSYTYPPITNILGNRMKRLILAIMILAIVTIPTLIGYYWLSQTTHANTKVDTSWVVKVNQLLEEAKPYPTPPSPDWLMEDEIHLLDNGTDQLVFIGYNNGFLNYLMDLLDQVNIQKNGSVPEEYTNRVLNSDKVVQLYIRGVTLPPDYRWQGFQRAYFILEDKLNEQLQGTIIIAQLTGKNPTFSIWAIAK